MPTTLGQVIKSMREKIPLTQEEIAKMVGENVAILEMLEMDHLDLNCKENLIYAGSIVDALHRLSLMAVTMIDS